MNHIFRVTVLAALLVLTAGIHTAPVAAPQNHSVTISSGRLCADGGEIEVSAVAESALGELFISQLYDKDLNGPLFTGNSHTFTELNEPHVFTVPYSGLLIGTTYIIAITNIPGEVVGTEGGNRYMQIKRCMLPVELQSFTIE